MDATNALRPHDNKGNILDCKVQSLVDFEKKRKIKENARNLILPFKMRENLFNVQHPSSEE